MTSPVFKSTADNQRAFYEAAVAGGTIPLAVSQGKFGIASIPDTTIAVTGNYRLTLQNNTTKSISVVRLSGLCTVTAFGKAFINPTVGLPSIDIAEQNAILGMPAPGGVVSGDTSTTTPLSGGTATGLTIPFGAGRREVIDLPPLIVPAGVTLGINIAAGASTGTFSVFWKVND